MTPRERREAIDLATPDDMVWLLDYLSRSAPTSFDMAFRDLGRMKNRAAAGDHCLLCDKAWPLPTEPIYANGMHGFACQACKPSLAVLPPGGSS